ncbi:helix-turn-helix transcriptional regulator [Pontibacter anaerobius]|uniref:Helix-turn-helix domain-containing protein n=1 Tax=Pontibacter anaerobius TaxID=2993940 RepID=A0ABT3RIZ6_9BACT|nr:helix-turn-helix domain-containing protein [Pontibacter anaerobius]MCX2741468.1 helix-turn-helix domain-containing protein [Pontibacter anaerobius]
MGFRIPLLEEKAPEKLNWLEIALNAQSIQEKQNFNATEACYFLGISKYALYHKTSRKQIPHHLSGKRLFFRRDELERWLFSHPDKTVKQLDKAASAYTSNSKLRKEK